MNRIRHCLGPILLMALILACANGCTKGARASRMLKAGNRDFKAEKYDEAEIEYRNVLRTVGLQPTAIGHLGLLYAKEGRTTMAESFLTKALEYEPNNIDYLLARGQVDLAFRIYTNAPRIAVTILNAQPTNEEALYLLASCPISGKELRQQMAGIAGLTANHAYHVALAQADLRDKKLTDAEGEVQQALTADPKCSQAYYALAEIKSFQKNKSEAAKALQNAAAYAPMRSAFRIRYADYLRQTGEADKAQLVYKEMTEKAPDYIPAWVSLMNVALAERKFPEAAKYADTILGRDELNYDGMLGHAVTSLAQGDGPKAVLELEHMDTVFKKNPRVKYELAVAYLLGRDKIKGIATLNQALAADPNYAQAALLLARLDIRSGDPVTAIDLMTRFLKKNPNVYPGYLLLANAFMADRKPDSALSVYRKLSEAAPKDPQIALMMGMVLAQEHRNAEARSAYKKCLDLSPTNMTAVQELVNLDVSEHRYNEAIALTQDETVKLPKSAEPWEIMAKVDALQGNMSRAEASLLKAIELEPNLPTPYLLLAEVYVRGNKYKEALQKLTALVQQTNSVTAYLQIGAIHDQLKDFKAGSDAYEKVLTIDPQSIPALNNLAYIDAVRLDNVDRAYQLATKARELKPYDPNVADTLGWVYYKKGDYARALALLEEAAERTPDDPEIQFHLGMTHYMLDEEDPARMALERAASSPLDYANKDEAPVQLALLNINTASGGANVMAHLEDALKQHPNDPVLLSRIGALQEQAGDAEKAADTYQTALKHNPDAVHIMASLARLYATSLNEPDKALSLANDAHKLAPNNAEVNAVLGHLTFRTGDPFWALSLLENAANRLPDQPQVLYDLAWAYYSVGKVGEAQATMQKALQTGVKFAASADAKRFTALAAAFISPSSAQAALGQAQQTLQKDDKYVPALMVAGVAAESAGDYKTAQSDYSSALQVFPSFTAAARQLAILDARHFSDDPKGYPCAEKARSAYPDDPEVARSLGVLSYYQSKYPRSAELLEEVANKSPNDGQIYYYLGMDYYQLKRTREGKQALGRALALKIPDQMAQEAKRVLASNN